MGEVFALLPFLQLREPPSQARFIDARAVDRSPDDLRRNLDANDHASILAAGGDIDWADDSAGAATFVRAHYVPTTVDTGGQRWVVTVNGQRR